MQQNTTIRRPESKKLSANSQQNQLIRLPTVIAMTCRSKASIYQDIKAGNFPKNIKIGERASAWKLHEVQAWIDEKCNQNEVMV